MQQVVAAGESLLLERPGRAIDRVSARFTDEAGVMWKGHVNGELDEL
jgi:hypothetical protein